MINKNLIWKTHVESVENKISKSTGIVFKASRLLNSKFLRSMYFAIIYPYINYANITWVSANKTYLKQVLATQKQAALLMMFLSY